MDKICTQKVAWLQRYTAMGQECSRLTAEIEHWRTTAAHAAQLFNSLPFETGRPNTLWQHALHEIEKLEQDLLQILLQKTAMRRSIETAVDALQSERLAHLLRLRYINGLTWVKVADAMFYSEMQIMRLHREALELLRLPAPIPAPAAASLPPAA